MPALLLSWPPNTPPSRLNLLRRDRYCGGVTRCVHEDIVCCCGGGQGCGCSNWPDNNCTSLPADRLPDLTFELDAPTCPSMDFECDMPRCAAGYSSPAGQGYWYVDFNTTECLVGTGNCLQDGSAALYCERNTAYPSPGCFDYKLDFGATVSGCKTAPDVEDQWPTSCSCGSYPSSEAWWRWDGVYQWESVAGFPNCASNCGCPGATMPIPINIYIHGMPPDPATLLSLPATASTPHRGIPVDDNLPEDVSNWLNGNN